MSIQTGHTARKCLHDSQKTFGSLECKWHTKFAVVNGLIVFKTSASWVPLGKTGKKPGIVNEIQFQVQIRE